MLSPFVRIALAFACLPTVILSSTEHVFAERKAFVVGISNYNKYADMMPLTNSAYSAEVVAKKLTDYGYRVTWLKTETQTKLKNFNKEWNSFVNSLKTTDEVVIYFSTHGLSIDGTNYLVPIDVDVNSVNSKKANLPELLIPLPKLVKDIDKISIAASVWILDACRNNPLAVGRRINLKQTVPTGHLFLYAAGDDKEALDSTPTDPKGKKLPSLYTRILLSAVEQFPKIDIGNVLPEVHAVVAKLAKPHSQNPYAINSLAVNWCFASCEKTQLQKLRYETLASVNAGPSATTLLAQKSFLSPQVTQNAIYLGKKSRLQDCEARANDTHPFGCAVLRDVSTGNASRHINKRLVVQIDTNVRLHAPIVTSKTDSRWSCPVRTLAQGDEIELNGLLELTYARDTFYWGTVGGNLNQCKPKEKLESNSSTL